MLLSSEMNSKRQTLPFPLAVVMKNETSVFCGITPEGRREHAREDSGEMIMEDVEITQQIIQISSKYLEQAIITTLHGKLEEMLSKHLQNIIVGFPWN